MKKYIFMLLVIPKLGYADKGELPLKACFGEDSNLVSLKDKESMIVHKKKVNISLFGALGKGEDDTKFILSAISKLKKGDTLFIPNPVKYYLVDTALTISIDSIIVLGESMSSTIIVQKNWSQPIFDMSGSNYSQVSNLYLISNKKRTRIPGLFKGNNRSSYCAGVVVNGDKNYLKNIQVKGFVAGIFLTNYRRFSNFTIYRLNNRVDNLVVDSVDYGLLATGQDSAIFEHIRGKYVLSQIGNPAHLVYILNHKHLTLRDCFAYDGRDGHAYQIKSTENGKFLNLNASNCSGILSLSDIINCIFDSISSTSDNSNLYSVFVQHGHGNSRQNTFSNIEILKNSQDNDNTISLDGNYNNMSNISVSVKGSTSNYVFRIVGNSNQINNITIDSKNNQYKTCGFDLQGNSNNVFNIHTSNLKSIFNIPNGYESNVIQKNTIIEKNH